MVAAGIAGCGDANPPSRCGDGACEGRETSYNCPLDCGRPANHCGDGYCNYGETASTCPNDCDDGGGYCGDGYCGSGETKTSCPQDCGGTTPTTPKSCGPDHLPIDRSGTYLGVSFEPQQCTEWCWAGVSVMVASYYGIGASECSLASVRNGYQQGACCFQGACQTSQCNTPAPPLVIESMLRDVLGIHGLSVNNGLTEQQVQTELSNGRPFIVGYLNSFAGHVVLVDGFQPSGSGYVYSVLDPFYGSFAVSYNQLAYGYMGGGMQWRWGYTAYHLSPRTDGCNTRFDPACACR